MKKIYYVTLFYKLYLSINSIYHLISCTVYSGFINETMKLTCMEFVFLSQNSMKSINLVT